MTEVSLSQNFDELFIKAERDPPPFCHINLAGGYSSSSGPTTRVHSNNNSRGSPARRPTAASSGLCPGNPALLGLKRSAATRSHSMRDQTNHMREKYQADKLNHRRLSTKSPAGESIEKRRNSSLTGGGGGEQDQLEVTRQFLATNTKVINRGDSFKRRAGSKNKENILIKKGGANTISKAGREKETTSAGDSSQLDHIYRVAFVGGSQVGKTSIIDQFMSSEHTNVYERETEPHGDTDIDRRAVSVDVNGDESRLDLIEPAVEDLSVGEVVEDCNPDCMVVVYAVDDKQSFEYAESSLDWLAKNNYTSNKPCILVGNKSDLARSRVVDACEGCDLALQFSVKFTETSPGCGHRIDELLVGIVMQLRLHEMGQPPRHNTHKSIKDTMKGILSKVTGKPDDEKKKLCRNLNV